MAPRKTDPEALQFSVTRPLQAAGRQTIYNKWQKMMTHGKIIKNPNYQK